MGPLCAGLLGAFLQFLSIPQNRGDQTLLAGFRLMLCLVMTMIYLVQVLRDRGASLSRFCSIRMEIRR